MNKFFTFLKSKLEYKPRTSYDFTIEESNNVAENDLTANEPKEIFSIIRQ